MATVNRIVGGTTPNSATFAVKVDGGGSVRVAVATGPGMGDPVFTSSQAVDAQGVAKVAITGLDPAARYWWQVEDNGVLDTAVTGTFRTHPPLGLPGSFTIGAASCAGASPTFPGVAGGELDPSRLSNHPVHETIRSRAVAEDWVLFAHMGDWGYPDWGDATVDDLTNRRRWYDDNLAQPNQAGLWRDVATMYGWDDHDYGANNSDGTLATKANGAQAYRERFPHYPLSDPDAIYQAPDPIGRVQLILPDVRFYRSPNSDPDGPSKTMLGAAQLAWLDNLLATSTAEVLLWLMPGQWLGTADDTWGNFATERNVVAEMMADHGFSGRVVMLGGDRHGVGIDSGGSNLWGGFPLLHCASLDSSHGSDVTGLYDVLDDIQGRDQYGTVQVQDLGSSISLRLSAWRGTTQLGTYQHGVVLGSTATVASGALLRTLTGSHTPILEARVVTGNPTGDDPAGTDLKIIDGSVILDGTAEVRGTLNLETPGISDGNGLSVFPRLPDDLLAPYGAELFVRYTLDLGGAFLRIPLGYYRIGQPDQGDAPYGSILLTGKDRMVGIVRAGLLRPRSFTAEATVGNVAQTLVEEIYPNAVILWDDDSDQTPLGRVLVVEESRYEALKDIADSQGKIMYWDDEGILRFETAPDESVPLWEVRSGRDGVLLSAGRRISTEDTANAIVLLGQAADDQPSVTSVVFDNNPQSPTYFFGPFGQAPRRHESVLVTNQAQADTAAFALLRRSLGASYEVEFTGVTNPTLRPWQPVRVTYRDGNRDVVVMQRVTIPLSTRPMAGTARASIVASVGSLA